MEEEGGPLHLAHQKALEDLRVQARALRPPGAALKATTQKLQNSRQQLDRFESDLSILQEQMASVAQKVQEKQDSITAKRAELEVLKKEAEQQERDLLAERGERPVAQKPNLVAQDLFSFDLATELEQAPEAKRALDEFMAGPCFEQIKQAMCKKTEGLLEKVAAEQVPFPADNDDDDNGLGSGKGDSMEVDPSLRAAADKRGADKVQLVALEKDDIEQLFFKLHKDGKVSDFTQEQLSDAVNSVQNTKHRKTDEGVVRTGGSNG